MTLTFKRAERAAKKARVAIYGPSGSGKTYTALSLARGFGGKTAFIDTERGSAQLYADKFAFDSLDLTSFHPDRFVEAIAVAEDAGYDTVIIDSLSHAWNAILDAVGARGGNTFTDGWGKIGTPLYAKLIGSILESKCHVIVCMRSKVEYEIEKNEKGKAEPKKIGLAPVMRADTEYEFDLVLTMDDANNATVSKTRMGDLLEQRMNRPDAAIGKKIADWLASGKPAQEQDNGWKRELIELGKAAKEHLADATPDVAAELSAAMSAARDVIKRNGDSAEQERIDARSYLQRAIAKAQEARSEEQQTA